MNETDESQWKNIRLKSVFGEIFFEVVFFEVLLFKNVPFRDTPTFKILLLLGHSFSSNTLNRNSSMWRFFWKYLFVIIVNSGNRLRGLWINNISISIFNYGRSFVFRFIFRLFDVSSVSIRKRDFNITFFLGNE